MGTSSGCNNRCTSRSHYVSLHLSQLWTRGLACAGLPEDPKRCEPAMTLQTVRHDSGADRRASCCPRRCHRHPWNFSSGRTERRFFQKRQAVVNRPNTGNGRRVFVFFSNRESWGCFLFGEKKLGTLGHGGRRFSCFSALPRAISSVATDAVDAAPAGSRWRQRGLELSSFWDPPAEPQWALWQYAHTMLGGRVKPSASVMAGAGLFIC